MTLSLPLRARTSTDEPGAVATVPTLEAAFRAHARYVAGVTVRVLGRDHEVDDVVQEVFLTAASGLERLRDPAAVRPWLATVTVRIARRRLRRRKLLTWFSHDDAPPLELAAGQDPEAAFAHRRVCDALDRLPADERIAWCLRYLHGDELQAVADATGCALSTVKRRIARAHAVDGDGTRTFDGVTWCPKGDGFVRSGLRWDGRSRFARGAVACP